MTHLASLSVMKKGEKERFSFYFIEIRAGLGFGFLCVQIFAYGISKPASVEAFLIFEYC